MFWLVTGPSCAGKTTLVNGGHRAAVIRAPATAEVVFPATFNAGAPESAGSTIYHYNILRRLEALLSSGASLSVSDYFDFQADSPWRQVLDLPVPKQALVLIVCRRVLLARMASRTVIEPSMNTTEPAYPQHHWRGILESIDLNLLYRAWCTELQRHGISVELIDSSNYLYRPMSLADLRMLDLNDGEVPPGPSLQRAPPG